MTINSRNKGASYEREVSNALTVLLGTPHERGARNGVEGADDVIGWPGVHIECKRRKGIAALRWLDQSRADAGEDLPIVVMREDRGRHVLMLDLVDLFRLCERVAKIQGRPIYPEQEQDNA